MANGHAIVRAAKVSGSLWYRSTACPMLGLEIIGRSLRVSALACLEGERLQWEPLTPLLNLLPLLGAAGAVLVLSGAAARVFGRARHTERAA